MKRYALLDTDFISKTHSVQDDGGNHLIDRVMELPEYEFFCHAQIVTELNRYNADTPIWLSEKIGAQKIKSYTDQEILESLSLVRGPLACATYIPAFIQNGNQMKLIVLVFQIVDGTPVIGIFTCDVF